MVLEYLGIHREKNKLYSYIYDYSMLVNILQVYLQYVPEIAFSPTTHTNSDHQTKLAWLIMGKWVLLVGM